MLTRFVLIIALAVSLFAPTVGAQQQSHTIQKEEVLQKEKNSPVDVFLSLEWRALGLANHLSHGPSFQAGITLFRHLKLGLGGFNRPGPINPSRFEVVPVDGQIYKGQSTLSLASDGAFIGLLIGADFDMPGVDWLHVQVPLILGAGAFGFFLTGSDRETPDGQRVSELENLLLDGRDASGGFGLDVGLRLGLNLFKTPWVHPYLGMHYTKIFQYDSFVTDDYSGPSFVTGFTFGGGGNTFQKNQGFENNP